MTRLRLETVFCCLSPWCVQVRHGGTIAQDIIRGLAYLHARGIVHGRLKTTNVLLNRSGVAKVADAALGSLLSHCKASSGTGGSGHSPGRPGAFAAWMAPEVRPPSPAVAHNQQQRTQNKSGCRHWSQGQLTVDGSQLPVSTRGQGPGDKGHPTAHS